MSAPAAKPDVFVQVNVDVTVTYPPGPALLQPAATTPPTTKDPEEISCWLRYLCCCCYKKKPAHQVTIPAASPLSAAQLQHYENMRRQFPSTTKTEEELTREALSKAKR
jgi:hypothetical protein